MSSDFVRYTPDIETIDPHLDELLPQIIEFWENKVRYIADGGGQRTRRSRRACEDPRRGQGRG